MKKLQIIAIMLVSLSLAGCARGCQNFERKTFDNHPHKLEITQYSGGDTINHFILSNGIVSNSESSDGYFFYTDEGNLIELSGDVKIEYLDK